MQIDAKYVHTNLIAKDWRKLAAFYENTFGCTPVPPQRDLRGEDLSRGSGVEGAQLQGMHLRLPGYGNNGPTLEIFQYTESLPLLPTAANRPGFGHICFAVPDVEKGVEVVLQAGGSAVGETVTIEIGNKGTVKWVYMADPEGNIVELQKWE